MFFTTEQAEHAAAMEVNDQVLIASAVNLGLVSEAALNEVTFAPKTIVRLNRADKMEQLTGQNATLIAKEKNDPLYTKLAALNLKRLALKDAIHRKYGSAAKSRAMKIISMVGKSSTTVPAGTAKA